MSRFAQQEQSVRQILLEGAQPSSVLQQRLELSQSAISRIIQQLQPDVITLGAARSTRYGLKFRVHPKLETDIPVYQVDPNGDVRPYATLFILAANEFGLRYHPASKISFLDHVPFPIQNMRPEGFMGRSFAQRWANQLDLPENLNNWHDAHTLVALTSRGEDMPGNLIIGRESAERYLDQAAQDPRILSSADRIRSYDEMAEMAVAGEVPGSSAGGEQPKFTAAVDGPEGPQRVIVKFAANKSEEGRRWGDLLICEHIAAETLMSSGVCCADTRIYQSEDWTFLESIRFDRVGLWGRIPLLSMKTLEAEFIGGCDTWTEGAEQFHANNLISSEDAALVQKLEDFGALIGNTDMHLGNLSFYPHNTGFNLAPVYDMTPMFYRPRAGGILPSGSLRFNRLPPSASDQNLRILARDFWRRAANNQIISEGFRRICKENLTALDALKNRPSLKLE